MNNFGSKLGNVEIVMVILGVLLGERIVSLPRVAVDIAGYGSILSVLIGGLVSTLIAHLIARLSLNFPNKTILEYSEVILGKAISKVFVLFLSLYFTAFGLLFIRRISEFLKQQLLFNTPLEVIIITLLFVSAFCAIGGMAIYAKSSDTFMAFAFFGIIFLVFLSISSIKPQELYPAFQLESMKSINIWKLGIPTYIGLEIIAFLAPFMKTPKDIKKASNVALLITTAVFTLVILITIGVIGFSPTRYQYFPLFTVAKALEVPGALRVDIVFTALWILFVYVVIVGYHYLSSITINSLFNLKSHKVFVILLIPVFYAVSLIPQNLGQMETWLRLLEKVWLYGVIGFIFIIYLVGVARKKVKI